MNVETNNLNSHRGSCSPRSIGGDLDLFGSDVFEASGLFVFVILGCSELGGTP